MAAVEFRPGEFAGKYRQANQERMRWGGKQGLRLQPVIFGNVNLFQVVGYIFKKVSLIPSLKKTNKVRLSS